MLSEKAQKIWEMKYARTLPNGEKETWEQGVWRVAYYVAQAEREHGATEDEVLDWAKLFYQIIINRLFIPGGRILANAGTSIKNLYNCFVISVEDSRHGIYDALGTSAEVFAHGGGVGYNFSALRERGAPVKSTGGRASGPVSFMELFDHTGEVISQASRRGAQMGILNCLSGDTEISTLTEGRVRIKDLVGKFPYLYCTDGSTVFVRQAEKVFSNGVRDVVRVRFDDDTYLDCTPDHRILLKNGKYKEAGKLRLGDSVSVFDKKLTSKGYIKLGITGNRNKIYEHWAVSEFKYGNHPKQQDGVNRTSEDLSIHHVDFNPLNNHPDNLELLTWEEHGKRHSENLDKYRDKIADNRRGKTWEEYYGEERAAEIREKRFGPPISNHKVISVTPIGEQEVFDISMPEFHNFVANGIFVHNCDHPDIKRFINYKSYPSPKNRRIVKEIDSALDGTTCEGLGTDIVQRILTDNQLTHFNISVGISDAFMEAVKNDTEWSLTSRVDGSVVKTVSARDLLRLIAESAWRSGDPGVIFLDRMEEDNMVPYLGKLEATNPCSEVTLLPNEPCCLGSINLSEMVEDGLVSEKKLSYVTTIATRFLDNVHTLNNTPIEIINETARRTRRLGLGVMGWADMLVKVNVPYDSEDSIRLARAVMSTIQSVAWGTSQYLAEERGTFAAWDREKVENIIPHLYDELPEMRNVAVTSLAPTGSIALLADVNGGIEPFFALAYTRYITEGVGNIPTSKIIEFNPHLEEYLETLDAEDKEKIKGHIKETGVLPDGLDDNAREVFKTAGEISWRDHIRVQAAFQKYVDNAISKTINMPEDSTVEDVMDAYIYAWEMGLKSVALYRDNSKSFQILNK